MVRGFYFQSLVVLCAAMLALSACKGKGGGSGGGGSAAPSKNKVNGADYGDPRPLSALSEDDIRFMITLWQDDDGKTYIFAKNGTLVTGDPSVKTRWKRSNQDIIVYVQGIKEPQTYALNKSGNVEFVLTNKSTFKPIKLSKVRRNVTLESWTDGLKDEETPQTSLTGVAAGERTEYTQAHFFVVKSSLPVNKSEFTDLQDSTVYGNSFDPSAY